MRRVSFASAAILLSAIALAACQQEPPAPAAEAPAPASTATAFEHARIIVGDGSVIEDGVLIIDGTNIVAVGAPDDVPIPDGAARIDATGKTIMPAIIDTHVHMRQAREELEQDLRRRAYFGVSAAMSLGQDSGANFDLRGAPLPGAARYFSSGRGITMPEPGRTEAPYWVTNEMEALAAVDELAALNVDIIKIWVDDRNDMYEKLSPELYGAIIDAAHGHGLRVTAHIFELEDTKGLLRAGIDSFAHGVRDMDIDEEGMALFAEHPDLVLVPNLAERGVMTDVSWLQGALAADAFAELQAENIDDPEQQEAYGIQARNLARLDEAGTVIALGTDGNTPWGPHVEMEDMVAAGMTPMEVIVAATRNGAMFLRMDDAGTLEPGKVADLLVLNANPLDNITNTRAIDSVYLQGAGLNRAAYP